MEKKIAQRFILRNRIGHGSFGQLYVGEDMTTREKVAIKMEHVQTKPLQLYYESKIYKVLNGAVGIPQLIWTGMQDDHNVMVIDLLDKSLLDLFEECGYAFSLKTILMIADQVFARIQYLHSKGIIHRDIKPDNFMIGMGNNKHIVHMIDYGLSKKYKDSKTGDHIPRKEGKLLTGTARYVSINVHDGIEASRRDDMESIGYMLIYLTKGSLPWQGLHLDSSEAKFTVIGEKKKSMPLEVLCNGLPHEFVQYMRAVRSLGFEEEPKYDLYRKMFRDLFIKMGYVYDYEYDWVLMSKREIPTPPEDVPVVRSNGLPKMKQSSSPKEPPPVPRVRKMPDWVAQRGGVRRFSTVPKSSGFL